MAFTEIEIRRNRGKAMVGELPRGLSIPFVPPGQVVHQDDAREGPRPQGTGKVGIDGVLMQPVQGHRFRQHAFVHVRVVHGLPPRVKNGPPVLYKS
jgi:hypothetical protein